MLDALHKGGSNGPNRSVHGVEAKYSKGVPDSSGNFRQGGEAPFDVVSSWSTGCWLVRLVHTKAPRIDHCVLVNVCTRMIWDPAELYPIRLSYKSLQMCGGRNCPNIKIAEAYEILDS